MTVFIASTTGITLDGDGSTNTGTFTNESYIDPVTGGVGLKVVRVINTSAANIAEISWTPNDTTYEFDDVAYTTDSAEGADAVFNVTVTDQRYVVEVVDGGTGFAESDNITVLGTALGGTTTANDMFIVVDSVDSETGAITGITVGGIVLWPQSTVGFLKVLPRGEEFIQMVGSPATGCYVTGNCLDGTMVFTPVTIVG